jgi:hypothetical protein
MSDRFADTQRPVIGQAVESLPLDVSSTDQTPTDLPNGFHCSAAGDVVGQLDQDQADRTFTLLAGVCYPYRFRIVRKTGTTATGVFVYTR